MGKKLKKDKRTIEDVSASIARLNDHMDMQLARMEVKVEAIAKLVTDLRSLAAQLYAEGESTASYYRGAWDIDGSLKTKAAALGVQF